MDPGMDPPMDPNWIPKWIPKWTPETQLSYFSYAKFKVSTTTVDFTKQNHYFWTLHSIQAPKAAQEILWNILSFTK